MLIVAAPVSLLAVYNYYRKGFVDLKAVVIIAMCLLIFSFMGSQLVAILSKQIPKRIPGIELIMVGF